jgi:signal peptidase I
VPLILVAAVLTPIRSSIADWNDVPSGSMRPTILEGDRIYVNKLAYGLRIPFTTTWLTRWGSPARGEIVTLKSPDDGIRLVKRVIGLPGDHISMRGNRLFINGAASEYQVTDDSRTLRLSDGRVINILLAEEKLADASGIARTHALTLTPGAMSMNTFKEVVVPEGQYFMMGDNRDMSRDSRVIGFVPLESIYGRAAYVALSLDPDNNYLPRWDRWFSEMK